LDDRGVVLDGRGFALGGHRVVLGGRGVVLDGRWVCIGLPWVLLGGRWGCNESPRRIPSEWFLSVALQFLRVHSVASTVLRHTHMHARAHAREPLNEKHKTLNYFHLTHHT
jgi:hypothetical protein